LPAHFRDDTVGDLVVERAATDPVTGFEHDDRATRSGQTPGGGQPGESGSHDHDVEPVGRVTT
jgi:hypothetical protein